MFLFKLAYELLRRGPFSWHQLFNFAWLDNILFKTCFIWEPKISRFLSKQKGNLFVDVGACYGRYVMLTAKRFRHIIAVEPEPQNMKTIKRNVKYAGLNNVEFAEYAISDRRDFANLYLGNRIGVHKLDVFKESEIITVKTETLASLLQNRVADLVKVDVEGAEWQVLKGAEPIIEKVKNWIIELHDSKRKMELEEWFVSHGYHTKWLDNSHIYAF